MDKLQFRNRCKFSNLTVYFYDSCEAIFVTNGILIDNGLILIRSNIKAHIIPIDRIKRIDFEVIEND